MLYERITLLEENPLSMPLNLPKLSDEDIAIIEKWIKNNSIYELTPVLWPGIEISCLLGGSMWKRIS